MSKKIDNGDSSVKKTKINRGRLTAAASAAVVIVFAGLIIYAGNYGKVYPNTLINGMDVGGLTYDRVLEIVKNDTENFSVPEKLQFTLENETLAVSSAEISLKPDADKTAALAMGDKDKKGMFKRAMTFFGSLFNETEIKTEFMYDTEKFDSIIGAFAAPFETEPIDSSYTVEGDTLILKKGVPGKKVDRDALAADIKETIVSRSHKAIALKLSDAESKAFEIDKLYEEMTSDAADAYYTRLEDGSVAVVPDRPKVHIDKSDLKDAIDSDKDTVTLSVKTTPAEISRAELEAALFCGTMGSWTSYYTASSVDRSSNVALSAERINGKILLPGETFSYDKTVGPRTVQNGFKTANVYINNKIEQGVGGGVCQTSSTLYSAVLYANLEIVQRTSHSLPVSYMPPGQDATIAEGAIDFQFRNNTDYPIKIVATAGNGSITCKIAGTPVEGQKVVINNTTTAVYEPKIEIETDASIPVGYKKTTAGSKGSAVSSSRTVYQNGTQVSTERLTNSVYNATPTVITVNPADKDTPPESLTEYSETAPAETTEPSGETAPAQPAEPSDTPSEPEEEEIIEI